MKISTAHYRSIKISTTHRKTIQNLIPDLNTKIYKKCIALQIIAPTEKDPQKLTIDNHVFRKFQETINQNIKSLQLHLIFTIHPKKILYLDLVSKTC